MSNTVTIPISIDAKPAARIADIGMQREFERILEHTTQMAGQLSSIDVTLMQPCILKTIPAYSSR